MVLNICDTLRECTNPKNLMVTLPSAFDALKADDASIEIVKTVTCINIQLRRIDNLLSSIVLLDLNTTSYQKDPKSGK